MKIKKVSSQNSTYPELLRQIPDAPKQLYVLGDIKRFMQQPRLAVVGSRKITAYGRSTTTNLVGQAARKGLAIVSGLALGVDSVAHQAALDNNGLTLAVMPCGLDHIYPASHRNLAKRILANNGVLVSEYPENTEPFKEHFIARNRIVSGLSDGVLITEAAEKSGTLHTANFALEQGRTVMAVPGNITSQLSAGTNNLIKTGATPITDVNDILNALGLEELGAQQQIDLTGDNAAETELLALLADGISDVNELQAKSNLTASEFSQTLTMLEIQTRIHPVGAGHWALKK